MNLDPEELNNYGHHHVFKILHTVPVECHLHDSEWIACNNCGHVIMFADDIYIERGYLHCQRQKTVEFQSTSLRSDLTVELLLDRREYLNMPWNDPLLYPYYPHSHPQISCDYDICWDCYHVLKRERPFGTIVFSGEC